MPMTFGAIRIFVLQDCSTSCARRAKGLCLQQRVRYMDSRRKKVPASDWRRSVSRKLSHCKNKSRFVERVSESLTAQRSNLQTTGASEFKGDLLIQTFTEDVNDFGLEERTRHLLNEQPPPDCKWKCVSSLSEPGLETV